jgi:hypothetical protein
VLPVVFKAISNDVRELEPHRTAMALKRERRVGFAALDRESLDAVLRKWAAKPGRSVAEMRRTLEGAHRDSGPITDGFGALRADSRGRPI